MGSFSHLGYPWFVGFPLEPCHFQERLRLLLVWFFLFVVPTNQRVKFGNWETVITCSFNFQQKNSIFRCMNLPKLYHWPLGEWEDTLFATYFIRSTLIPSSWKSYDQNYHQLEFSWVFQVFALIQLGKADFLIVAFKHPRTKIEAMHKVSFYSVHIWARFWEKRHGTDLPKMSIQNAQICFLRGIPFNPVQR